MTRFEQDLQAPLNINGNIKSKGIYNLIVSKRDAGLWKMGMKPHRNWKITDVKEYFGIKGNKESIYAQLCTMVDDHLKS